mgnify:CR=1 FL=1
MKKITLFLSVLIAAFCFYPQSYKYNELLETANQFKENQNWIYALGYYADAINEDPAYSEEAFTEFTEILTAIGDGFAGSRSYSEIESYQRWKKLLKETEQYWTEFCPYIITIGPLEIKSETKKATDYWADVKIDYSEKFLIIMNAIEHGYRQAYDVSWDLPAPVRDYSKEGFRYCNNDEYWPRISVTKGNTTKKGTTYLLTTDPEDFYKDNVATLGISSNGKNDYEPLFEKGKNLKIFTDKAIGEFYNAFAYHEPSDIFCETLYEAQIKLETLTGEEIKPAVPYLVIHRLDTKDEGFKIELSDVPSQDAEIFKNGNVTAAVEEFSLHFGFQTSEMYNKPDGTSLYFTEDEIFRLPKLVYPKDNIKVYYSDKRQKDRFAAFLFANIYREDLAKGISEGLDEFESSEGYMQYLSDLTFTDDYIEITFENEYLPSSYRIPLWIMAQICSKESDLPLAYDNFGNQINDEGFVVGLDPSNQYYTFRHALQLSEAEKSAMLANSIHRAEVLLQKKKTVFELADYYYYSNEVEYADFPHLRILFNELEDAVKSSDNSEIAHLTSEIDKIFTQSKYFSAITKSNQIHHDADEAKKLFKKIAKEYNQLYLMLKNDEDSRSDLIEIYQTLNSFKNLESIFEIADYRTKFEQLPFADIQAKIAHYTKLVNEYDEIYSYKKEQFDSLKANIEKLNKPEYYEDPEFIKADEILNDFDEIVSNGYYAELEDICNSLALLDFSSLEETVNNEISFLDLIETTELDKNIISEIGKQNCEKYGLTVEQNEEDGDYYLFIEKKSIVAKSKIKRKLNLDYYGTIEDFYYYLGSCTDSYLKIHTLVNDKPRLLKIKNISENNPTN